MLSKAIPNLDIKSKGSSYIIIYLPHLSYYPLTTSNTSYSLFTFKIKALGVTTYTFYPCPYYNLKTASKATLF